MFSQIRVIDFTINSSLSHIDRTNLTAGWRQVPLEPSNPGRFAGMKIRIIGKAPNSKLSEMIGAVSGGSEAGRMKRVPRWIGAVALRRGKAGTHELRGGDQTLKHRIVNSVSPARR
jgi:hypothetical protein